MFTIIQDTREQIPFDFSSYDECQKVVIKTLKTGDYSLDGLENNLFIERKRSTGELANNLGVDKVRFFKELERMSKVKWKYIVCEFSIDDIISFPTNSGIPKNKWSSLKFTGRALYKIMKDVEAKFGVKFIFAENSEDATDKVIEIFKKVKEYYEVGF